MSSSPSQLTLSQLASTINAHGDKATKYIGKAEEHFKAQGIHLLEAKSRISAGEYEGGFVAYLKKECRGLSSSRAYELISIGNGSKTVASLRQATAARVQKSRQALRYVAESATDDVKVEADEEDSDDEATIAAGMAAWAETKELSSEKAERWHNIGAVLCAAWKAYPTRRDFDSWRHLKGFHDIPWKTCLSVMFSYDHAESLERLKQGLDLPESAGNSFVRAVNEIAATATAEDLVEPPRTPEEALIMQIAAACQGKTIIQLKSILRKAGG